MSDKKPFRATSGLDAAGQRAINFGYPDKNQPMDAVSVDFFTHENTIQEYSDQRKYEVGFAVKFNNQLFTCEFAVTAPEPFNPVKWKGIRTDPTWRRVNNVGSATSIEQGEYIVNAVYQQDVIYTLPSDAGAGIPAAGDTVVFRDELNQTSDYSIQISGNGKVINGVGPLDITQGLSTTVFSFVDSGPDGYWIASTVPDNSNETKLISNRDYSGADTYYVANVGDKLARRTSISGGLRIRLPKFAQHGDTIETYDIDALNPVTKTEVFVHPQSTHEIAVDASGTRVTEFEFSTTGWGLFVFDETTGSGGAWRVFDADIRTRWNLIETNHQAQIEEKLNLVASDASDVINVTFPESASTGDSIIVSTGLMVRGSTVNLKINPSSIDTGLSASELILSNPRPKDLDDALDYSTPTGPGLQEISIVIEGRARQWEFHYEEGILGTTVNRWVLVTSTELPFRVDNDEPNELGLIALATTSEVNTNVEQLTDDRTRSGETAVTPYTLANKISTESHRGINRTATDSESKATSGSGEAWDNVQITPKTLNARLATESRRGVAETATQAEASAMTGSGEAWNAKIVTPERLNNRKSTESQTGITRIATQAETNAGTESYAYVTPLKLRVHGDERYVNRSGDNMNGDLTMNAENKAKFGSNGGQIWSSSEFGPLITATASALNIQSASSGHVNLVIKNNDATDALNVLGSGGADGTIDRKVFNVVGQTGTASNYSGIFGRISAGTLTLRPSISSTVGQATINTSGDLATSGNILSNGSSIKVTTGTTVTQLAADGNNSYIDLVSATGDLHRIRTLGGGLAIQVQGTKLLTLDDSALKVDGGSELVGAVRARSNSNIFGTDGSTPMTVQRTSGTNVNIKYRDSVGDDDIYAGMAQGTTFAIGNDAALSTTSNRWMWTNSAGVFQNASQSTANNSLTRRDWSLDQFVERRGDTMIGDLELQTGLSNLIYSNGATNSACGIQYEMATINPVQFGVQWNATTDDWTNFYLGDSATPWNDPIFEVLKNGDVNIEGDYSSNTGVFGRRSSGTMYLRPSGINSTTNQVTITNAGMITANRFASETGVFGAGTQATIYLRPNGTTSSTNQLSVSTNGNVGIAGTITTSKNVYFGPTAVTGTLSATTNLTIGGTADINGNTDIGGGLVVTGNAQVQNFVSLGTVTHSSGIKSTTGAHNFFNASTGVGGVNMGQLRVASSFTGGTVPTNGIYVQGNVLTTVNPTANYHLTTKVYVDDAIDGVQENAGLRVAKAGDVMTGELIINSLKAITTNGDVDVNGVATVQVLRIAAGNGEFLELRANPTTRSVDFVWVS